MKADHKKLTSQAQATPMMAQFIEIKSRYADALLFYRMGDFYELFFDDAIEAAEILNITLTHRGKHLGEDIPMCGVPVHSAESYLHKLIATGRHVAICEQIEDPAEAKKRGAKAVVRREVVRLVTPGTLTEESLLAGSSNNFLAAITTHKDEYAIAWADISTGEFTVASRQRLDARSGTQFLEAKLAAIAPGELLLAEGFDLDPAINESAKHITRQTAASFDARQAQDRLCGQFGVASMEVFGNFSKAEMSAMGAISAYLSQTLIDSGTRLRPPELEGDGRHMQIDMATRRNLEIYSSLSGAKGASLIEAIDRTITLIGARRLYGRLQNPLCDISGIHQRLALIGAGKDARIDWGDIRKSMRAIPDFERALGRLFLKAESPRDLRMIGEGLSICADIGNTLPEGISGQFDHLGKKLASLGELGREIMEQIEANAPNHARDGGYIRSGAYGELDRLRALQTDLQAVIAKTQAQYIELSGVAALKIRFNSMLGYFIEVPATHSKHMLGEEMGAHFIHRQSTKNALRFSTNELGALAADILSASDEANQFERRVLAGFAARILPIAQNIRELADSLGELDIISSQLELAARGWVAPIIDEGHSFEISGGRHPVVENALRLEGHDFIANDCTLGPEEARLWLVTGPNMAGKSTFLRQNALIAILAHCGFYVPAEFAKMGVVDRVFSRVGAADDLARGRSTFMVEMIETAAIINQAGPSSLVILDEIGRGTATYDGLAIAWAVLEYLLGVNKCRGLFATHFHELTALEHEYDALKSVHIAVREWKEDIVFLHNVEAGSAARSYGVDVAKLAGLPGALVARARDLLMQFEENNPLEITGAKEPVDNDEPGGKNEPGGAILNGLGAQIAALEPDKISPKEALEILYELKEQASNTLPK